MPVLKERYEKEIRPAIVKEHNLGSIMAVAKIEKIVVNMGISMAVSDKKYADSALEELSLITGQRAVITKAKKSIANFKLREGMPIGCMVTLRGSRMYDFLERLIFIALPRVRDFQGIPRRGFDGRGNYNLGIKEHTIFPEINFDKTDSVKGLNITVVTTAKNDDEAFDLLLRVGLPFRHAPKTIT